MEFKIILTMAFSVIGGLGLFLLGMKQMSEGMQAVAGERLRSLIGKVTDNRFVACGVGASVTALIQSSSVTTVMIVGMANAGLITLRQSIGVIMGADIGTTITAWIIALKIADYGLPILGVAALVYLFAKEDKPRYTALIFLGLGMIFFGLQLMKGGFQPLREEPEFIALLTRFNPTNLAGVILCVLVGSFVTAVIQSSSATVAITITLASTGAINYETAVALVLGQNIGTTITAFLASLGTNTTAKRTAYAHILIKVIGVSLMIPLFYGYMGVLKSLFSDSVSIATRIALAHSGFNILIVSLFLPLINPLTRLVERITPDKPDKEKHHLTYLDVRIYDTPAIGLQQSFDELLKISEGIEEMSLWLREILSSSRKNPELEQKIFHREYIYDEIQKEIVEFISKILTGTLPHQVTAEARKQLRIADEYESISDYLTAILKLYIKRDKNGLTFSKQGSEDILTLHDLIHEYLVLIGTIVKSKSSDLFSNAIAQDISTLHKIKDVRSSHLQRFCSEPTSPYTNLIYMDILSAYRRIKDHSLNIAEAVMGEK